MDNEKDISSFMFQLPLIGESTDEGSGADLKWLNEQSNKVQLLFDEFIQQFQNMTKSDQKCPPHLLHSHWEIINALAMHKIALIKQEGKRQGAIKNESDMQEVMNQFETLVKKFPMDPS